MIERLIRGALEQRLIVLLLMLGLIVSGVAAFRHLPIDAFPDVTPVQVQVITRAPSGAFRNRTPRDLSPGDRVDEPPEENGTAVGVAIRTLGDNGRL